MNERTQRPVQPHIPEGYMMNAAGHLVPANQVREQDLLRDALVSELAPEAIRLHEALTDFKKKALADIDDLVAIAGERYGVQLGGKKGNISLTTYDGRFKVQRTFREVVGFTEEIEAAKELIEHCLNRWTEDANQNVRAIVGQAFRTNTKGEIKTGKVLELMRLDIQDDEWQRAMEALKDALQNVGTAVYVRVYERIGQSEHYKPIPLDLAAV